MNFRLYTKSKCKPCNDLKAEILPKLVEKYNIQIEEINMDTVVTNLKLKGVPTLMLPNGEEIVGYMKFENYEKNLLAKCDISQPT